MRNFIQISVLTTVLLAGASTADADSPRHGGNGTHAVYSRHHGHGHAQGRGHGPEYDHDHRSQRYHDDLYAALRDDRRDLQRISRVRSDWEHYRQTRDYRGMVETRRRLNDWLRQEIVESRAELRAAERELRDAQQYGSVCAPHAALYRPNAGSRAYVQYPQDLRFERSTVKQARDRLQRLGELQAQLRISRAQAGPRVELSADAAVLDELVWSSAREVRRGEAEAARWSARLQYAWH